MIFRGISGIGDAGRDEEEILKMFHRQNRVDVNAVITATGARGKLVRKVLARLQKEGELPGVNVL